MQGLLTKRYSICPSQPALEGHWLGIWADLAVAHRSVILIRLHSKPGCAAARGDNVPAAWWRRPPALSRQNRTATTPVDATCKVFRHGFRIDPAPLPFRERSFVDRWGGDERDGCFSRSLSTVCRAITRFGPGSHLPGAGNLHRFPIRISGRPWDQSSSRGAPGRSTPAGRPR